MAENTPDSSARSAGGPPGGATPNQAVGAAGDGFNNPTPTMRNAVGTPAAAFEKDFSTQIEMTGGNPYKALGLEPNVSISQSDLETRIHALAEKEGQVNLANAVNDLIGTAQARENYTAWSVSGSPNSPFNAMAEQAAVNEAVPPEVSSRAATLRSRLAAAKNATAEAFNALAERMSDDIAPSIPRTLTISDKEIGTGYEVGPNGYSISLPDARIVPAVWNEAKEGKPGFWEYEDPAAPGAKPSASFSQRLSAARASLNEFGSDARERLGALSSDVGERLGALKNGAIDVTLDHVPMPQPVRERILSKFMPADNKEGFRKVEISAEALMSRGDESITQHADDFRGLKGRMDLVKPQSGFSDLTEVSFNAEKGTFSVADAAEGERIAAVAATKGKIAVWLPEGQVEALQGYATAQNENVRLQAQAEVHTKFANKFGDQLKAVEGDPYKMLGVSLDATQAEIDAAHKEMQTRVSRLKANIQPHDQLGLAQTYDNIQKGVTAKADAAYDLVGTQKARARFNHFATESGSELVSPKLDIETLRSAEMKPAIAAAVGEAAAESASQPHAKGSGAAWGVIGLASEAGHFDRAMKEGKTTEAMLSAANTGISTANVVHGVAEAFGKEKALTETIEKIGQKYVPNYIKATTAVTDKATGLAKAVVTSKPVTGLMEKAAESRLGTAMAQALEKASASKIGTVIGSAAKPASVMLQGASALEKGNIAVMVASGAYRTLHEEGGKYKAERGAEVAYEIGTGLAVTQVGVASGLTTSAVAGTLTAGLETAGIVVGEGALATGVVTTGAAVLAAVPVVAATGAAVYFVNKDVDTIIDTQRQYDKIDAGDKAIAASASQDLTHLKNLRYEAGIIHKNVLEAKGAKYNGKQLDLTDAHTRNVLGQALDERKARFDQQMKDNDFVGPSWLRSSDKVDKYYDARNELAYISAAQEELKKANDNPDATRRPAPAADAAAVATPEVAADANTQAPDAANAAGTAATPKPTTTNPATATVSDDKDNDDAGKKESWLDKMRDMGGIMGFIAMIISAIVGMFGGGQQTDSANAPSAAGGQNTASAGDDTAPTKPVATLTPEQIAEAKKHINTAIGGQTQGQGADANHAAPVVPGTASAGQQTPSSGQKV